MINIENSAVDTARKNMEKALEEYKNAVTGRQGALKRYLEASAAYRTILTQRYKI